ncbi:DAK2 domain-containing protein [Phototrophicus methaneseepsis]|uniref:DAK2 domain-containing protein n=1 Tax=Phototrophicus methaneseepsis TaxID=2710758 RepID=A0A7S8ID90_9CHLR|nr:DAK2 domain-containing protein [Phototrophicus methaneseepsis]QPC80548.1 DAK2 domain-containing protein [Phototrophicus methaneseepsis]
MVFEAHRQRIDGQSLKYLFSGGVVWLSHHAERINMLNVFPVPDGDTGTNMLLTVRKAEAYMNDVEGTHIGHIAAAMARGARYGARGNSGTILSMLLQGFAQALANDEWMDAAALADACQNAVDYAYDTVRTVMEPQEGTILTVARAAAEAVVNRARDEEQLYSLLETMLQAAKVALDNTPSQLPVLKEAGVVDSGGAGLVALLEGMKRLLDGEDAPDSMIADLDLPQAGSVAVDDPMDWETAIAPDDERGYGYDVQFLMLGTDLDVQKVRREVGAMGWSALIDGDKEAIKVHIHVYNPAEPIDYVIRSGAELEDVVIENMQRQYEAYRQRRTHAQFTNGTSSTSNPTSHAVTDEIAVVAVARGAGLMQLLREYGAAAIVEGGQTMNPSTSDFIEAIDRLPNTQIVLLPNNSNVILAAREAASLSQKSVTVVPTKSVPQGIAALLAYSDRLDDTLDEVTEQMKDAVAHVRTIEITTATRSLDQIYGVTVREGDFFALVDNKPAAAAQDVMTAALAAMASLETSAYELVTVYYGVDVTEAEASALIDQLKVAYPSLEYESVDGGQPLYPFLLSVE